MFDKSEPKMEFLKTIVCSCAFYFKTAAGLTIGFDFSIKKENTVRMLPAVALMIPIFWFQFWVSYLQMIFENLLMNM